MMNRRDFNKVLLGATALSFAACTSMNSGLGSLPASGDRVVVVGGGFGGATAAKYIKRFSPDTEVVLVEMNKTYYTCPFSNTVLAGINDISFIAHDYKTLEKKHGVKVVHKKVKKVDGKTKNVVLEDGTMIPYTKAVVAPGIDFKFEKGYEADSEMYAPHAYKAGAQTTLLRKQLEEMKDGGTFVMVPPGNPFRCPPGPYERVSLIADYFKKHKPNSKIIILDQKNKFSKQGLFTEAWENLYGDMIEWRSAEFGGKCLKVDPKNKVVSTEDGDVEADVLNYIPYQKAGMVAHASGLTKGDWCPVNTMTFESRLVKDVYVIGDASIATKMPKSGFSANSQAKIAALQISRALKGKGPVTPPKLANTCYSLVSSEYGITVAAVYEAHEDKIVKVEGAGGLSPMGSYKDPKIISIRMQEAAFAEGWYKNQTQDIFR